MLSLRESSLNWGALGVLRSARLDLQGFGCILFFVEGSPSRRISQQWHRYAFTSLIGIFGSSSLMYSKGLVSLGKP